MITLLMIAALGADRIDCALDHVQDGHKDGYPSRIVASCPADHAEADLIQAAADASMAALDLDPPRPSGFDAPFALADRLTMVRDEGAWRAEFGEEIIFRPAVFPIRAVRRGADLTYCAIGLHPDAQGVPQQIAVSCIVNNNDRGSIRQMERDMRESAQHWRYAPVEARYCFDRQIAISSVVSDGGRPRSRGPDLDPAQLPDMCADLS